MKINKLKLILLFITTVTLSFSFKISDLKFGKEIEKNKSVEKTFILTNNNLEGRIYRLSIEGDKNIKISPNILNLSPQQEKNFTLKVTGKKSLGEHDYFLIIYETRNINSLKEGVGINKKIRIKQKYKIVK